MKSNFEAPLIKLEEWAEANSNSICVADNLSPERVLGTVLEKNIHHLLQINSKRETSDLRIAQDSFNLKNSYFESEFCFFQPVNKNFLPFLGAKEKSILRDKVASCVDHFQSENLTASVFAVFEELYMNAVIDAPREASKLGSPTISKANEFFIASSADTLQISCSDFYGALNIEKLLLRMHQVLCQGVGESINFKSTGGAGIGCVLLWEQSISLIIGVKAGVQTKVTCILPVGVSNRAREKMKKSLHWFQV